MSIGTALFGSGGKSKTIAYPTIDYRQAGIEFYLNKFLEKNGAGNQAPYKGDTTSKGPSTIEALSLAGLENEARQMNRTGGDAGLKTSADALSKILKSGPTDISQFIQDSIVDPTTEVFQKNRAGVAGRFSDNFFGSQRATADAKNFEDFSNALASSVADASLKARQSDMENKLQAASLMPAIAKGDSEILTQLLAAGAVPREIHDKYLQSQYDKFKEAKDRQGQYAELMAKFLGIPMVENITTTKGATKGLLGGAAEGIGSGFGKAAGAAAGAAIFSDRRLKSNIKFLGKLNGYNWYEYDIFGTRQTGVMAQEVLAIKPEAVSVHDSGYLMVNYNLL